MELNTNLDYGILLKQKDILLQRRRFSEMCRLLGVNVQYYAPRPGKHWTTYAEIASNYYEPSVIPCIFDEHMDAKTMKKLGWNSEKLDSAPAISVSYDLKDLQVGALFVVPSPFDNTQGRLFRVTELSTIMIYPASITCKLAPEFENTFMESTFQFEDHSMDLLAREEDHL